MPLWIYSSPMSASHVRMLQILSMTFLAVYATFITFYAQLYLITLSRKTTVPIIFLIYMLSAKKIALVTIWDYSESYTGDAKFIYSTLTVRFFTIAKSFIRDGIKELWSKSEFDDYLIFLGICNFNLQLLLSIVTYSAICWRCTEIVFVCDVFSSVTNRVIWQKKRITFISRV